MNMRSGAHRAEPAPQRFFVVRVMKTGSSTLLEHIRTNFPPTAVFPVPLIDGTSGDPNNISIPHLLGLSSERRAEIRAYMGHFPYIAYEMLGIECTTITVLREPIARAISHLRMAKLVPHFRERSFEELYDEPFISAMFFRNHQVKYFAMTPSDPLTGITDGIAIDDARLALAKANLEKVDVFGLVEHYGDFLAELSERFGWSIEPDVVANVSSDQWRPSEALRRRIEADNLADIEFYEFARALRAKRRRATTL